jgi:hypothetical protein
MQGQVEGQAGRKDRNAGPQQQSEFSCALDEL